MKNRYESIKMVGWTTKGRDGLLLECAMKSMWYQRNIHFTQQNRNKCAMKNRIWHYIWIDLDYMPTTKRRFQSHLCVKYWSIQRFITAWIMVFWSKIFTFIPTNSAFGKNFPKVFIKIINENSSHAAVNANWN